MIRALSALLVASCLLACSGDPTPGTEEGSVENRGADIGEWWKDQPRPEWSAFERVDSPVDWFEVYRIRDHIYAIYEPGQFEEVISYLILGEDRALLFDTGLGMGDIRKVVRSLASTPVQVVNSHSHYDHVGGNHLFELVSGFENRFSGKRSKGLGHEQVGEYASPAWIARDLPQNFDPARYRIKPWEYSHWIERGEFIDLGGLSLEVLKAPGHSPDSIVLIDHQNRLMFTGDTFYPAPLYAHIEGSNFKAYRSTAERLAQRMSEVDSLLMSHNVPEAPASKLQELHLAFEAIFAGAAEFETTDGARQYSFDGFSILTADPP